MVSEKGWSLDWEEEGCDDGSLFSCGEPFLLCCVSLEDCDISINLLLVEEVVLGQGG